MKTKKITAVFLGFALLMTAAGCQKETENASDESLYGRVSAIDNNTITLSLAKEAEKPGEEAELTGETKTITVTDETKILQQESRKDRALDENGEELPEKTDDAKGNIQKKSDSKEEEPPEKPDGEEENSQERPDRKGEKPDGDMQIPVTDAQISDIEEGDMIKVTLDGEKVTDITIQKM